MPLRVETMPRIDLKSVLSRSPRYLIFFLLIAGGLPLAAQNLVAVQPLGKVDSSLAAAAKAGIEGLYYLRAEVLPAAPLPASAYYKPRGRYRAEKLLDHLDSMKDGRFLKVVGLTAADISTTKGEFADWGIFGLGSLGGTACVVSTHRLRSGLTFRLGRGRVPEKKFLERLVKVVNHELGHTLGLDHCPHRGCLMEDAAGTIRTVDRESGELCASCRARIEKFVK
jgi:archaemetzincin